MVKLDKIVIYGLRSFGCGEDEGQQVKFSSPLTVLLGPNGSGKTTVIEALKFACSGEVPEGSSKGQGFVHDPKLTGSYRTKGHVRLRLESDDSTGLVYSIFKICEVTQNLQTLTFKRCDATLTIEKNGEKKTISGRCTDIDTQCRQLLGVSAAIINNVIFCHQENSTWPLSDGKKLKEKFDEIFDAVTYNKCIENMRRVIKDGKIELGKQKIRVAARKEKKEDVERLFGTLNDCKRKLSEIEKQIEEKVAELKPIEKEIVKILEMEKELSEVKAQLAAKEADVSNLKRQQEYILKNLDYKEFEGNDEKLEEEISSFNSNRTKYEQRKTELEQRKSAIEEKERAINAENTKLQVKIGQLKQEKTQHEKICSDGNSLIAKIVESFSLSADASFGNNTSVKRVFSEVENAVQLAEQSLEDLSMKIEAEDAEMQSLIDEKNKMLTEIQQSIQLKEDLVKENEQKKRDISCELADLRFSDEQLNQIKGKIDRIDADLAILNAEVDIEELSQKIDEERRKKRQLQDELQSLEKVHKILQQNSDVGLEMDLQRNEIRKLESDIHKLNSRNFENFSKLFGDSTPESGLKKSVESLLQMEQRRYEDITRKINLKEKEIATITANLASANEKLRNDTAEYEKGKEEIAKLCKERSLQQMLSDTEKQLEEQQNEKGHLRAAKIIFEKFVTEFETDKACCPVCQTNFANKKDETNKIVRSIKSKVSGIPNQLAKLEEELRKNQDLFGKLLQLKPVNEKAKALGSERIPSIRKEIEGLTGSLKQNKTELERLEKSIEQPKLLLEICRKTVPDAALIDQQKAALDAVKAKIASLETRLLKVPSDRSKQQIEMDIDRIKEDITSAERNYESWQKKIDQFKSRSHQFNERRNGLIQQQLDIQRAMQNKPKLEEQVQELGKKNEQLLEEIQRLAAKLGPLENELDGVKSQKESLKARNQRSFADQRRDLDRKTNDFGKLKELQKEVEAYMRRNVDGLFEEAVEKLKENKKNVESIAEAKEKIAKTIVDIKTQLATQDASFRSLENNQQLRKVRGEEKRAVAELEKIRAKVGRFDHISVDAEKGRLGKQRQKLNDEIAKGSGQKAELADRIRHTDEELNKPGNRDAQKLYRCDCYKYVATLKAVADLERYTKQFEDALIQFHASCMLHINIRIRQLWREIYRGNDIDYVEIKTEAAAGTQLRRSYKYRVVQVKNGVELDMSGRCSAGQKVLASIIIRLALAERFSINCGIMALDEPTTNLDKENIVSLSNALVNIVNNRRDEKNFQLIVITHDEDFLQELKMVDGMNHYWRVSRNDEGISLIRKTQI